MTDEARPPFDYESLDAPDDGLTPIEKASETIKKTAEGRGRRLSSGSGAGNAA